MIFQNSSLNFKLSWVEYEKSSIISWPYCIFPESLKVSVGHEWTVIRNLMWNSHYSSLLHAERRKELHWLLHRESSMSAQDCTIELILLNELMKSNKMWGLQSNLMLFRRIPTSLIKSIIQEHECMLDSIYHMTLKLFCNCNLSMKTSRFCHI